MPQKTKCEFSALAVHSSVVQNKLEPHAATPHITHALDTSTHITSCSPSLPLCNHVRVRWLVQLYISAALCVDVVDPKLLAVTLVSSNKTAPTRAAAAAHRTRAPATTNNSAHRPEAPVVLSRSWQDCCPNRCSRPRAKHRMQGSLNSPAQALLNRYVAGAHLCHLQLHRTHLRIGTCSAVAYADNNVKSAPAQVSVQSPFALHIMYATTCNHGSRKGCSNSGYIKRSFSRRTVDIKISDH